MSVIIRNKKGFSLVELLIAVAIMVILAAIAVGIFSNVLNNSVKRSDDSYAKHLETAVQTYITESEDLDLYCGDDDKAESAQDLVNSLSSTIVIGTKKYGPYLNSNIITLSKDRGLSIEVNKGEQVAKVIVGSYNVTTSSSIKINE